MSLSSKTLVVTHEEKEVTLRVACLTDLQLVGDQEKTLKERLGVPPNLPLVYYDEDGVELQRILVFTDTAVKEVRVEVGQLVAAPSAFKPAPAAEGRKYQKAGRSAPEGKESQESAKFTIAARHGGVFGALEELQRSQHLKGERRHTRWRPRLTQRADTRGEPLARPWSAQSEACQAAAITAALALIAEHPEWDEPAHERAFIRGALRIKVRNDITAARNAAKAQGEAFEFSEVEGVCAVPPLALP
jgi:hypothetical protein